MYVHTSITVGVASSVANDVTMGENDVIVRMGAASAVGTMM